jgi:hypothetical protein
MFDIEQFIEQDFINFFKQLTHHNIQYCIKGGMAYDVYFKSSSKSKDYDIIVSSKHIEPLMSYLFDFVRQHTNEIVYEGASGMIEMFDFHKVDVRQNASVYSFEKRPVEPVTVRRFGIENYEYNGDPYILDVAVVDHVDDDDVNIINDVKYLSLTNFIKDFLLHTVEVRYNRYKSLLANSMTSTEKDNQCYEIILRCKHHLEQRLSSTGSGVQLLNYLFDKFFKIAMSFSCIETVTVFDDTINTAYVTLEDRIENESEELYDVYQEHDIDSLLEECNGMLRDVIIKYEDTGIRTSFESKYNRVMKRLDNILDIRWENLTPTFQTFLTATTHSGDIELFRTNNQCHASLHDRKIIKDTSGCLLRPRNYYTLG